MNQSRVSEVFVFSAKCDSDGEAMREHPLKQISDLKSGDIIRHFSSSESYVVTETFGSHATAARTLDVSHAAGWVVIKQDESDEFYFPSDGQDCLWLAAPNFASEIRRAEALLIGRNVLAFDDGFYHGRISPTAAWTLTNRLFPEGQIIIFGGFRLQVTQMQSGALVWGRKGAL